MCLANVMCLLDTENPEISWSWKLWISFDTLLRTLKIWRTLFFDFNGDPEIRLSLNRTKIIFKYRKIMMQKLYEAEIWTLKYGKNLNEKPLKTAKRKINPKNPEFYRNWLLDTLKYVLNKLQSCVNNGSLKH